MACKSEYSIAIGEFVAGRLDAAESKNLLDHVAQCEACSEEFDVVADVVRALDRQGTERVANGTTTPGTPTSGSRSFTPLSWRALRVVAAAVLVCIAIWWAAPEASLHRPVLGSLAMIDPIPATSVTLRSETPPALPAEFASAMDWYSQKSYDHAAFRFEQALVRNPDHLLSQLYLGICRLNTNKPREAVYSLDRVAEQGKGLVRERALWYLANTYLKLEEKENALARFMELESLGMDFELNARDMIRKIREIQ